MQIHHPLRVVAIAAALALAACGGDDNNGKSTNNGQSNNGQSNNGQSNNDTTNNVATNNDTTNNGDTNNGTTNNGTANNDTNNGTANNDTNNGTTNNGTTNNGTTNNGTNNLCAEVVCTPPAASCNGNIAVTYSGDGTCDPADGMCDFTAVTVETTCADTEVCEEGACVAFDPTPVPGALVISEIMYNPSAVGDTAGEWFEVHNTTDHVLDLQGLKFQDAATGGHLLELPTGTPIELPADGYYVVGVNDDLATNGGAPVNSVLVDMSLAQGGDTIVVLDAADTVIDSVEYDRDNGWPDVNGASLQLGSEFDPATQDNADLQYWCGSYSAYGDGDFGTPGAANESCAPVTATIYAIQDETDPNHPVTGRVVNVVDVAVTAIAGTDYMWVQEQAGGQYSGLYIDLNGVDVSAFAVGDVVDISGTYTEFQIGSGDTLTGVLLNSITDKGTDVATAPEVLEVSAILADPEPWENVLLQVVEVGVTDNDIGFGEIQVDGRLIIDEVMYDGFGAAAMNCQIYASITGPLNYSFGAHKIAPRDVNDIGASRTAPQLTAVTIAGMDFVPSDVCVVEGATVSWTNADAVAHTVTSRLPTVSDPTMNIPATPVLDLMLAPTATESYMFTDAGSYHYRCRPHPMMQGQVVVTAPPAP